MSHLDRYSRWIWQYIYWHLCCYWIIPGEWTHHTNDSRYLYPPVSKSGRNRKHTYHHTYSHCLASCSSITISWWRWLSILYSCCQYSTKDYCCHPCLECSTRSHTVRYDRYYGSSRRIHHYESLIYQKKSTPSNTQNKSHPHYSMRYCIDSI